MLQIVRWRALSSIPGGQEQGCNPASQFEHARGQVAETAFLSLVIDRTRRSHVDSHGPRTGISRRLAHQLEQALPERARAASGRKGHRSRFVCHADRLDGSRTGLRSLVVPASEPGPITTGARGYDKSSNSFLESIDHAVWVPARRPGRRIDGAMFHHGPKQKARSLDRAL
jgi:hypothetical protein